MFNARCEELESKPWTLCPRDLTTAHQHAAIKVAIFIIKHNILYLCHSNRFIWGFDNKRHFLQRRNQSYIFTHNGVKPEKGCFLNARETVLGRHWAQRIRGQQIKSILTKPVNELIPRWSTSNHCWYRSDPAWTWVPQRKQFSDSNHSSKSNTLWAQGGIYTNFDQYTHVNFPKGI